MPQGRDSGRRRKALNTPARKETRGRASPLHSKDRIVRPSRKSQEPSRKKRIRWNRIRWALQTVVEWSVIVGIIAFLVKDVDKFMVEAYPVEITLEGLERLDPDDVFNRLDSIQLQGMLKYPLGEAASRIAALPAVREVTWIQRMPSELVFNVVERTPVAYVTPEARGKYYEIDGEGVVLNKVSAESLGDMPVIWLSIAEDAEPMAGEEIPGDAIKKGLEFLELYRRSESDWPTLNLVDLRGGKNLRSRFKEFDFAFWWGIEEFDTHFRGFELALSQLRNGMPVRHHVDLRFSLEDDSYFVKD